MDEILYPGPNKDYKVLVRCFTYNQSKYIEDTLNGFVMQKTNFPFVCLVMDDCSTDGEQSIIKEWMDGNCDMRYAKTIDIPTSNVIIVTSTLNSNCKFVFYLLKQNLWEQTNIKYLHVNPWREKCTYEAICEGDDYWTDGSKLQKQVDFLDANPEYSASYGKVKFYNQEKGIYTNCDYAEKINNIEDLLLRGNKIPTCTVLMRRDLLDDYNRDIGYHPDWMMGDYPLFMYLSVRGKLHYLEDYLGVYRVLQNSATCRNNLSKRIRFIENTFEIQKFFMHKYGVHLYAELKDKMNNNIFNECYINHNIGIIKYFVRIKRKDVTHYKRVAKTIFHSLFA